MCGKKKIAVLLSGGMLMITGLPVATVATTLTVAGGAAMIAGCGGKSDTRTEARTEARTAERAEQRVDNRHD